MHTVHQFGRTLAPISKCCASRSCYYYFPGCNRRRRRRQRSNAAVALATFEGRRPQIIRHATICSPWAISKPSRRVRCTRIHTMDCALLYRAGILTIRRECIYFLKHKRISCVFILRAHNNTLTINAPTLRPHSRSLAAHIRYDMTTGSKSSRQGRSLSSVTSWPPSSATPSTRAETTSTLANYPSAERPSSTEACSTAGRTGTFPVAAILLIQPIAMRR